MPIISTSAREVPLWSRFEVTLAGPSEGNPFRDIDLRATFSCGAKTITADGFYDGDGVYKVRHMPEVEGEWHFETQCSDTDLGGLTGAYTAVAPEPGAHGPVYVRNQFHFAYADGTPYAPFGRTCYAWTHQEEAMQRQTLATLSKGYFNKIRMGVFPKHYIYSGE